MGARPDGAPPRVLGLTGGIGAGKSEALAAFAECGAATLSSDAVVHALYHDPEVRDAVVARFGPGVLDGRGEIDRALLGPRLFADRDGMRYVESLLFPRISGERERWIAEQRRRDPPPPVLVCEVPLLFEADLAHLFDAVVVVTASEGHRRQRVEARGQDFDARSSQQMPEGEKVARADHVYVNDGTRQELWAWIADRCREYAGGRSHEWT